MEKLSLKNMPVEDIATVNVQVNELADWVHLYFNICAAGVKSLEDGSIEFSDLVNILPIIVALPAALTGNTSLAEEIKDLSEDEIYEMVRSGEKYELGENAYKFQKVLLVLLELCTLFIYSDKGAQ